ncbi:MAG: hypothetical protein ACC662_04825 [Planctomycetota bacterium]
MDRRGAAGILPPAWIRSLEIVASGGGALTLLGWVLDPGGAGSAWLVAALYVLGLGLGGLVFVAFAYLTRAGWSVAFRRVPEGFAATLPLGALFPVLALVFLPWLYPWSDAAVVASSHVLQGKSAWLTPWFFRLRAVVYLLIWLLFALAILRTSRRQDVTGGVAATRRNTRLSAAFLVVFAITFSLASFDWIMSLEPHWYSTVFAIYNFSGLFVSGLAGIVIVAIVLRRRGPLEGILRPGHLHDLGKLLLGFTTFWAYIWFSQFMLIWYGNIPEETAYFTLRQEGAWSLLMLVNVAINWGLPFLVLLSRATKRSETVLLRVCALLLVGRWLDLYLMVAPPHAPDGPRPTLWDVTALATALALFVLVLFRVLSRTPVVPRGDPLLEESLRHRT